MTEVVRRFTSAGIARFRQFLEKARTDPGAAITQAWLHDKANAEAIPGLVLFSPISGTRRLDAAKFVDDVLSRSGVRASLETDCEFWAWLVAANFDHLCPKDVKTLCYRVGTDCSYWIPELKNYRRRHRHRLSGPYFAYRAHLDDLPSAMGVLGTRMNEYNDLNERVLSTEEFQTSRAINYVVTTLYYSKQSNAIKRGVSGTGEGCSRRLIDVLAQFALTYDLGALTGPQLLAMLPVEFDWFRLEREVVCRQTRKR